MLNIIVGLFILTLCSLTTSYTHAGEAKIAAASSLTFVLEELAAQFEKDSGETLKISYASSGVLSRQIARGAPFELFLSADESYIERLYKKGLIKDKGEVYTQGLLVIYTRIQNLKLDEQLTYLDDALNEQSLKHFSIPNPDLAPYGKVAKQVLKNKKLLSKISPFLIYGENASQSAMFVNSGAVNSALLPQSLALELNKKIKGQFQLVSRDLYQPLNQRMVLLEKSGKTAHNFYHYILEEKAQKIFFQHGFHSKSLEK